MSRGTWAAIAFLAPAIGVATDPPFVLVKQVNCPPGHIVPVRAYQDGTVASVLYFRLAGAGNQISFGRNAAEIDFGKGRKVSEPLDRADAGNFTVRVPFGYNKQTSGHVKCTLKWSLDGKPMYWTWKLEPLPAPERLLDEAKRSSFLRAHHVVRDGTAAIELDVLKASLPKNLTSLPAPKIRTYIVPTKHGRSVSIAKIAPADEPRQGKIGILGDVQVGGYSFEATAPRTLIPELSRDRDRYIDRPMLADDQDSMRVVVVRKGYLNRIGTMTLPACRLEAAADGNYLAVPRDALIQIPGLAQIVVFAQRAKLFAIKTGKGNGFAVILSTNANTVPQVPSKRLGVTFEYAGPDLARFGLAQVQMAVPRHPLPARPKAPGGPLKLGALPPLSIRYYVTVSREEPILDVTIPIEYRARS